jgi:hypothetical protein
VIARHGRESFVLYVKKFREHAAGCPELICLEVLAAAFLALPVFVLHTNYSCFGLMTIILLVCGSGRRPRLLSFPGATSLI